MKSKLPNVVISYYPLSNKMYEYQIWVGESSSVLLYVYSEEKEDEAVIKDWTTMWWNSINQQNKKKVYN